MWTMVALVVVLVVTRMHWNMRTQPRLGSPELEAEASNTQLVCDRKRRARTEAPRKNMLTGS